MLYQTHSCASSISLNSGTSMDSLSYMELNAFESIDLSSSDVDGPDESDSDVSDDSNSSDWTWLILLKSSKLVMVKYLLIFILFRQMPAALYNDVRIRAVELAGCSQLVFLVSRLNHLAGWFCPAVYFMSDGWFNSFPVLAFSGSPLYRKAPSQPLQPPRHSQLRAVYPQVFHITRVDKIDQWFSLRRQTFWTKNLIHVHERNRIDLTFDKHWRFD